MTKERIVVNGNFNGNLADFDKDEIAKMINKISDSKISYNKRSLDEKEQVILLKQIVEESSYIGYRIALNQEDSGYISYSVEGISESDVKIIGAAVEELNHGG
jgi:hypothetical protein